MRSGLRERPASDRRLRGFSKVMEELLVAGLGAARRLATRDAFCRDLAIVGSDRAD